MTELEQQWASSRVEAMADGSLDGVEAGRMRVAMAEDAELAGAVARAAALRRALTRLPRAPVPRSLRGRLLGLARRETGEMQRRWPLRAAWALGVTAAVVGLGLLARWRLAPEQEPPPRTALAKEQQADAVAEFAIAMTYLHRSALIAKTEVTQAVGGGLRDAVAISREAARDEKRQRKNGG